MLGCIKYNEALGLLQSLFQITVPTGRCFLSTGGLNTEIGLDYPHRDLPVSQRWAPPGRAMGEKHEIFAPQCLYLESDREQKPGLDLRRQRPPMTDIRYILRIVSLLGFNSPTRMEYFSNQGCMGTSSAHPLTAAVTRSHANRRW